MIYVATSLPMSDSHKNIITIINKKLSYRRETARQLPTWRGVGPPAHSLDAPSGYIDASGRIRNPQQTYVTRAVHETHFKMNRAFKVIQGHPYWCRQESRMVCCRNVQLIPTLFPKLTKIRQRENGKFVDFNNLMQV